MVSQDDVIAPHVVCTYMYSAHYKQIREIDAKIVDCSCRTAVLVIVLTGQF